MHAIVIGAGIGGLATAGALRSEGHEVTVIERSEAIEPIGAGISIFANGFRALDELGLADRLRHPIDPALRTLQRTPGGDVLAELPRDPSREFGVLHRADLQRALLERASGARLLLGVGARVEGACGAVVASRAGGEDAGELLSGDLVVIADGIRSRNRATVTAEPGVRYSGYTAWRAVTRHPVDLSDAAGETWGFRERFGIAPLPDGRVYWFAVASLPEATRFDDEFAEVRRRFEEWHAPIPALLDATHPASVLRHDIHDLARPLPTFVRGRCVLVGDAAHAMTPDLGQGGGQALEDAATLGNLVGDGADLDAALAAYDALRRPRTQSIARRARSMGRIAHVGWRPVAALRDTAIRMTPTAALARAAAAVGVWEPPARTVGA
ncbi:FAD-dependent monooxygenase [Agromyces sp. SYSU K20354]|uniref:FAD-dependent monooxygenase n=1 Tax=Agromyces cavernae TaxID=2898659 RepID=UPI001E615619|nr:FAD-dependent monooxygenase [Agromyces cavernae]MCD2443272.1 FAD-dependent monooxygenase [Agromyces cavernae]